MIEEDYKKELSNLYISECFRIITQNTAKLCNGDHVSKKLIDLLEPDRNDEPKGEQKTGEQIAAEVIRSAGIKVVYNESI